MADHNMVMSESEISALKDTLCAQQQLLQKLYNELDAEREASASAASEALSVILRLQGEKAAVKMEAEQYKRLSEEKICHAEESLAIIEDIIYQKEMEVAALDYQVQAYKCKLLSMGCVDLGLAEIKFPENPLQRNEDLSGETSLQSTGKRNSSSLSLKYKKAFCERESSTSPEMELIHNTLEEQTGQEACDEVPASGKKIDNSCGGISSYWEQIRKLDLRVKDIAGNNFMNSRSETRSLSSLFSQLSAGNSCDLSNSGNAGNKRQSPSRQTSVCSPCDSNIVATVTEAGQIVHSENIVKNDVVDHPCSPCVHDVFEVPQVDHDVSSCELDEKCANKTACQGSGNLKRDVVHPDVVNVLNAKDEPKWLKKVMQSSYQKKNLFKPSNSIAIGCHFTVVQPEASVSETPPGLNQLNRTSEIVEDDRPADSTNREEEIMLLNEIKEQLSSLHDEVRSLNVKKSSTKEDPSLCHLREAMLYFWL